MWLGALAIIIATFIAYLPALSAGYIWDDDDYVTENELLVGMEGLHYIWLPEPIEIEEKRPPRRTAQYYPVVFTTFWVEYQLWGLDPFGYHLINVLLHIANAFLLWRILVRLKFPGAGIGAALVAAVFALHPVHVESVAWITERKNVLSGFLYLASALIYLRFETERDDIAREKDKQGIWGWYGASLALFALALLSKSVTCSLPAALILIMLYQRRPMNVKRLLPLAPMFILGLLAAMHTAHIEREHVGAEGIEFALSWVDRLFIASKALLFYPGKIIWPHPLIFIYPRWETGIASLTNYLAVFAVAGLGIFAIWLYLKGRRGPFLALAFFAGTVFPAIGFFNVYPHIFSFVADHFQYLASIGVIALLIGGVFSLFPSRGGLITKLILVCLPVLVVLTFRQGKIYENEEVLWRATIERNPDSWMSYNNLGHILLDANKPEEAETFLRQCLDLKPDHFNAMSNLAEALRRQKRDSEALFAINQAIDLGDGLVESGRRPSRAFLAKEYHQLGLILMAIKHARQAERAYMTSLELEPDRPPVNFSYALLLMERERFEEASKHFRIYLDWNPNDLVALDSMGQIAEDQERYADAKTYYRRAVDAAMTPRDQVMMGSNYIRFISSCPDPTVRRIEEGIAMAESMNRASRGQMPEVLDVLAAAYAQGGRFDDAVKVCERALQIARAAGRYEIATEIESRLERYRNQKVFWE